MYSKIVFLNSTIVGLRPLSCAKGSRKGLSPMKKAIIKDR